jgi:prolyl 4-hydroxylase
MSTARVSKSAWLLESDDKVVERIHNRVGYLTDLDMKTAEELQIANYGIGGMYEPHFDFAHVSRTHSLSYVILTLTS